MLPRPQRLNLKKDFKWVAAGQSWDHPFFKAYYRRGLNSFAKVGIALSGKNFKKAHQRNRARRITSAALEQYYSSLPNNLNLILLPKARVLEVKSGDVSKELKTLLEKIT